MAMAENTPAATLAAPAPRAVGIRLEWGRAFRALRRLLADSNDTAQVFEIMRALNGRANARNYQRLLSTVEGGRIAGAGLELADLLMDQAWLDGLPDHSVGAGYRDFIRAEQLSAEGLAQLSRQRLAQIEAAHPYAWFGRRTRDIHDIWHVLSGYGREPLGEACLVAFSYAQTQGLGWALIAFAAARRSGSGPVRRAIWQGFRRGRASAWLLGEDYERLLREPLDAARQRLGITPPTAYEAVLGKLAPR